jgi:DNA polymerase III epsilon subunit family exonuclease
MDRTHEYLRALRALDGLRHAVLAGIHLYKKEKVAEFLLITDRSFTEAEEVEARRISGAFLPAEFTATVKIAKRVLDEDLLRERIFAFVCGSFPAAAAFLKAEDISIQLLESGANFYFSVAADEQSFFTTGKLMDAVSAYLSSQYCGTFYGNVRVVQKERDNSALAEPIEDKEEVFVSEIRTFPIEGYKRIDGADTIPTDAVYIADMADMDKEFAVCGVITYLEAKNYVKRYEKTGEDVEKVRYSLTISDGSGMLRCTYFPKKATEDKIKSLQVGDSIVILGVNEEFNGQPSFKATKINLGHAPEGFTPKAKASRPVPKFYHTVFPEPYVEYKQAGFFDVEEKPAALKGREIVVFDLETTGLVWQPSMGRMDKIIEVGAVKLIDGEIREKFTTFVACDRKLDAKIVELTGIHDEDLVGAPTVDKVIADFFKFVDGAILVGHNVNFDYGFVRHYGKECGYIFSNPALDTMLLAQEQLAAAGLVNYKLNTIAEYYGFDFNHHRAFEDAATTAKVFVELIKKRGSLPL